MAQTSSKIYLMPKLFAYTYFPLDILSNHLLYSARIPRTHSGQFWCRIKTPCAVEACRLRRTLCRCDVCIGTQEAEIGPPPGSSSDAPDQCRPHSDAGCTDHREAAAHAGWLGYQTSLPTLCKMIEPYPKLKNANHFYIGRCYKT